ncbi:MAG: AraC-like DNA-binding protein [Akkermansiaceae bacterium]|jgi:AraC-like DNA-binding protein
MVANTSNFTRFFERIGDHVVDSEGHNILEMAYEEGFMVSNVAVRLRMTVREFEVELDRAVGMKPKNFFRQYRAVMARRQIQEGQNLHVIAADLGFRHYSHFSSEMKGFYGIPPLKLQKLIQARCNLLQ